MLDLSPAKWIWLPSGRTLPNTFVLFRRTLDLKAAPQVAKGWIAADSRYRLWVNGQRVQFGPAPHDPRHAEADPLDLVPFLRAGENAIAVEVLFYGHGDGTWPFGKPGLLLKLEIDGETLVTDETWRCEVDRAHQPGQYKRWFLRALQEEFDARLRPVGWDVPDFDDTSWAVPMDLGVPANRSAYSGDYPDYLHHAGAMFPEECTLDARSIAMLAETFVPAREVARHRVVWRRPVDDWFQFRMPDCFEITEEGSPSSEARAKGGAGGEGADTAGAFAVTYDLGDECVGFPCFEIDASKGTTVELMVQEYHDPQAHPWLDTHFHCWSRFVCREGLNRFEAFDYEAAKWIQVHVHGHTRSVEIRHVGMRRRRQPWPNEAQIATDDPRLQRLFDAALNTLDNSAQDVCVDGMGRERQQYSGDGGHKLVAVRYAFGEDRLPARFLRTFAHGQLLDGVFADSWPAWDRLARQWQRNVDASGWGPLLDHSVGFLMDHHRHWMHTGDLAPARENWPRLCRFAEYLEGIVRPDGLLPVEGIGANAVWMDHEAYRSQAHKHLAFNLYAAATLQHCLVPLARELGDTVNADRFDALGKSIQSNAISTHWDDGLRTLVVNPDEAEKRHCDRSLATALLYRMLPDPVPSLDILERAPSSMGLSYPANAIWRYHALAEQGRVGTVLNDFRTRWADLTSVRENNALQEDWTVRPDGTSLMSHCAVAPLTVLFHDVMGLRPLEPGFRRAELRPRLGDLRRLDLVAHTPRGPVRLRVQDDDVRAFLPDGETQEIGRRGRIEF